MIFRRCGYILIIFALLFTGCGSKERKKVYFKDTSFIVEVARTKQEQERGLMFRKYLPLNSGMFFIYESEDIRPFYMKNMYIPLDIIWMNKNKQVVFMKKNAKPANGDYYETIRPTEASMYVIELNAGTIDKIGLKTGDILRF